MAEAWPSVPAGLVSLQTTTERTHDNSSTFAQRQQTYQREEGPKEKVRFAHPAEAVVADLLSHFGVKWLYEPVTFPLVISETGKLVQCFTPDFYLPDHDIYIEMTTMRQSLVTRKNRKFRLMRELYPEVNVRLLYRKDVELIVERSVRGHDRTDLLPGPPCATADQVAHKAAEIAGQLAREPRPVTLIALGNGAVRFRDQIAASLAVTGIQAGTALVQVKRSRKSSSDGEVDVYLTSERDLRCSRRVLVADVVSTGLTVNASTAWFRAAGIPVDGIATLLDRRSARLIDTQFLVPGLSAPSTWVVGSGLGGSRWARYPDIHSVARADQ